LFRRTVHHAVTALTPRLYVFGTAGEGYAVTDRQFEEIVTAFVHEMNASGGISMVGVISLSLGTIVQRLNFAHRLGVREFQLSLPSWGALADEEVDRFFDATCGAFPDAKFLHYNLTRAKRLLTGADYARLAARHENFVAIKMGGENLPALSEIARAVPQVRCFFTEFGYMALREQFAAGLLCALGVCEPTLARRLFEANGANLKAFEPTFRALHAAAKSALGDRSWMDAAYDKMFVKLHFPEFPLRLLPPYSSPDDSQFATFQQSIRVGLRELRV
jgi:dihydrodipicolinate synthase/N-acetylneuraminate lyase